MDIADIDFDGSNSSRTSSDITANNDNNKIVQEDVTNLNSNDNSDITSQDGNKEDNKTNESNNKEDNNNISSTGELSEGDTIEVDGITYTVDTSGNLVDDKGNIFKEAKDIADWLKTVDIEDNKDDSKNISISSIQEALGITVTDAEGKNI